MSVGNPDHQPPCTADPQSSSDLLPIVYEELRQLAAARMARQSGGQTLQPTALVHEAWIRLAASGERDWKDRSHFFRTAAQAMRQILVDRARHKSTIKVKGAPGVFDPATLDLATITPDDRLLLIDDALHQLEAEEPMSARVVTLRFFAGMTNEEVAKVLSCSVSTVERKWAYAKARLLEIIQDEEGGGAS
jgi:RNA polymerase sigma factor (TIGR02999 family)